jgi:SAM-dependent methyltransferase
VRLGFQAKYTKGIMMRKSELAFGRIPAYCKYELFMERYRSAAETIRNQVNLTKNKRILDVGCGEGYMRYFFDHNEGRWFGVERWKERIEISQKLGYEVVDIDINSNLLPYPDGFFDIVIASHVIEHLSNIDFALKEMDRVLKKDGLLLIATPTKPPLIAWLVNLHHKSNPNKIGETQNAFSASSLKRFIGKKLPNNSLIECKGFRLFSSRKKLKLDNIYLFYIANKFLGEHATFLVPEVNLVYKKSLKGPHPPF